MNDDTNVDIHIINIQIIIIHIMKSPSPIFIGYNLRYYRVHINARAFFHSKHNRQIF